MGSSRDHSHWMKLRSGLSAIPYLTGREQNVLETSGCGTCLLEIHYSLPIEDEFPIRMDVVGRIAV